MSSCDKDAIYHFFNPFQMQFFYYQYVAQNLLLHDGAPWSRILVHVGASIGRMAFFGEFHFWEKLNGNHGCRFSKKGVLDERMKRM